MSKATVSGLIVTTVAGFAVLFGVATCNTCAANAGIFNATNDLNDLVYEDVNKNGMVESIDLTLVEAKQDDKDYLLNFYGSAVLNDGTEVDIFTARYNLNQSNYIKVLSVMDGSSSKNLEDLYVNYQKYGMFSKADDVEDFLNGLIEVASSAEYVGSTLDGTIEAVNEQKTICSLSNPVEKNGILNYNIVYAEIAKSSDGRSGILTHSVDVYVDKASGKTEANEIEQNFVEVKPNEGLCFGNDFFYFAKNGVYKFESELDQPQNI